MEIDAESSLAVGEGRLPVKQQGEAGTLSQMGAGGAATDEAACLLEELGREVGAVER